MQCEKLMTPFSFGKIWKQEKRRSKNKKTENFILCSMTLTFVSNKVFYHFFTVYKCINLKIIFIVFGI